MGRLCSKTEFVIKYLDIVPCNPYILIMFGLCYMLLRNIDNCSMHTEFCSTMVCYIVCVLYEWLGIRMEGAQVKYIWMWRQSGNGKMLQRNRLNRASWGMAHIWQYIWKMHPFYGIFMFPCSDICYASEFVMAKFSIWKPNKRIQWNICYKTITSAR